MADLNKSARPDTVVIHKAMSQMHSVALPMTRLFDPSAEKKLQVKRRPL